ncbi:MAG: hypothetical protein D6B26_02975 [Spirochaetaceae bacterium]|nr:MAG: hypothetical protein D6B26_02975 [Spirochaetaceae bacterium]
MYENIIGYPETTAHLRGLLRRAEFPQALLLAGEPHSGKCTIALETARALTCGAKTAEWGCGCAACEQHRRLEHSHVLHLGSSSYLEEIQGAIAALRREVSTGTRYLFGRSIRKLLNRFHPVMWEGDEKRISAAMPTIEKLQEQLPEIFPDLSAADGSKVKDDDILRKAEALLKSAEALIEKMPNELLNADAIRRMNYWVHVAASKGPKVIILEHVETFNDSQRNLLLKTLEEPPANVYFILTTSRHSAILPTILSRVRVIRLEARPVQQQLKVLERVFRLPAQQITGEHPLRWYFRRCMCENLDALMRAAERWAKHLIGYEGGFEGIPEEDLPVITETTGAAQRNAGVMLLRLIVEALQDIFRKIQLDGAGQAVDIKYLVRFRRVVSEIDQATRSIADLNMNAVQVLESLWFHDGKQ